MRRIGLITLLISLPGIANGLSAQETQDRPDSIAQPVSVPVDHSDLSEREVPYRGTEHIMTEAAVMKRIEERAASGETRKYAMEMMRAHGTRSGNTGVVAGIPYEKSVSPSGARVYKIPIGTASGAKFAPSVSLLYNSQGGNGEAGYGWTIAGLPMITVRNSCWYYDGSISGGAYDSGTAKYSLDGNPIVSAGAPGIYGFSYKTVSGQILVRPYSASSGNGRAYFKVLYPDGSKAVFGTEGATGASLFYPITRLEDALGNVITFTYDYTGPKPLVTGITYDGGDASISFGYISRQDSGPTKYSHGQETGDPEKLLKTITSTDCDGTLYQYNLIHSYTDGVNLLEEVGCTMSGAALPPLSFSYGDYEYDPANEIEIEGDTYYETALINSGDNLVLVRGKFVPGECSDGLVIFPSFSDYVELDRKPGGYVLWGSGCSPSLQIIVALRIGGYPVSHTITAGSGFQTIRAADVDGDGVDELVKVNFEYYSSMTRYTVTVYSFSSSGAMSIRNTYYYTVNAKDSNKKFNSPAQTWYWFGNFRGSGKTMLAVMTYQNVKMALFDLDTGVKTSEWAAPFQMTTPLSGLSVVADFEGDGKDDFCHITDNGMDVYSVPDMTGNSFSLRTTYTGITKSQAYYLPVPATDVNARMNCTDINGDGYLDVVFSPGQYKTSSGSTMNSWIWNYFTFTGNGFVYYRHSYPVYSSGDKYCFYDADNDGLPDLIRKNGGTMYLYLNADGIFNASPIVSLSVPTASDIIPAVFGSSGRGSQILFINGHYFQQCNFKVDHGRARRLTGLIDSYGLCHVDTFGNLAKDDDAYLSELDRTYNASYGFYRFRAPLSLLKESDVFNGEDLVEVQSYLWFDAVMNNRGLGFCGFGRSHVVDAVDPPHKYTDTVNDPQKFGVPTFRKEGFASDYPDSYQRSYYSWSTRYDTYTKDHPVLDSLTVRNDVTGTWTQTANSYDSYELPTIEITTAHYGSGTSIINDNRRSYSHTVTESLYRLGAVQYENSTRRVGDSTWTQTNQYVLDSLKRPVERRRYVGPSSGWAIPSNLVSTTRWQYDAKGNVVSEQSAPYGATTYTGSTCTYDSFGRLLLSRTDALGRTITYTGHNRFGKPGESIDHLARENAYAYSAIGELVETGRADGSIERVSSSWGGEGLYVVTSSSNAGDSVRVHYDALQREILREEKAFDGRWRKVRKEYDASGRLYRESLPFVTGSPQWIVHTYDNYDRPVSVAEPSGKTTTWSYNGMSVQTVKDGITSTVTRDAAGRTVSVSDAGGTITYSLRPDGQPSSTSVLYSGSNTPVTTNFSYDAYGRRTGMTDPGSGAWTYSYQDNADGSSSASSTGPNGTVTTSKDRYGRTTSVARGNSFTTSYTYDTYGRLTAESSTNGTGVTYTYDWYGRVLTSTESLPDTLTFTKAYGYNAIGQLSSVQYTAGGSSIATENYLYTGGVNTHILLNGSTPILQILSEDEYGNVSSALTGSTTRTYAYSQAGLPTQRTMGDDMDFSYSFNSNTGNLSFREDNTRGNMEEFWYDSLNRLDEINSERWISYSSGGNILSVDEVGTMTYGSQTNPYLLTSFTPEGGQAQQYPSQNVTYTSFDCPGTIAKGQYSATFVYGGDNGRVKMSVTDSTGTFLTRYYAGGRYEKDVLPGNTTKERLYLGGDAYSAPMVLARTGNGSWTLHNIGRDYLGSIVLIASPEGFKEAEYSYDAWGRLRNPSTLEIYAPGSEPELMLGRGFTGHEHLPWLGLINMNARLYDPLTGRFLAPDPYVQDPGFTQNYNRYTYALNNPLKYTDESGELFGTILTAILRLPYEIVRGIIIPYFVGFSDTAKAGRIFSETWSEYGHVVSNAFKIETGMFHTDKNKSWGGRTWEFFSRYLWQPHQVLWGRFLSLNYNFFGNVKSVTKSNGLTTVETYSSDWGAFTLGNYTVGERGITADFDNTLFQHEYGHYIQSQVVGPAYFSSYALPSVFSIDDRHDHHPVEQDANIRSRNYMIKNGLPFEKWNYDYNPIDKLEGVDRDSPELMEPLPVNRKPFISSYIFPVLFPVLGDIITGAILSSADNARKY